MFKKIRNDRKAKLAPFIQTQKQKQLLMKVTRLFDDLFESIYTTIISNILNSIIDSVIDLIINISKYNTVTGSSYIKLPKELDHPKKYLINVNDKH